MSRDIKRTWSQQAEEIDGPTDMGDTEVTKSDSRENSSSRKKSKPNTDKNNKPKKLELETDPVILQRRQKQIDYGKNTVGYANYSQQVTMEQRTKEHPKTPDKYTKYSRRAWDMLIKIWRKKLHEFDTGAKNGNNEDTNVECGDDVENICDVIELLGDDNDNKDEANENCNDDK